MKTKPQTPDEKGNSNNILLGGLGYLLGRLSTNKTETTNPQTNTVVKYEKFYSARQLAKLDSASIDDAKSFCGLFNRDLLSFLIHRSIKLGYDADGKKFFVKRILEVFNQGIFGDFSNLTYFSGLINFDDFINLSVHSSSTIKVEPYDPSKAWLDISSQNGGLINGIIDTGILRLSPRNGKMSSLRHDFIFDLIDDYISSQDNVFLNSDSYIKIIETLKLNISSYVSTECPELKSFIDGSISSVIVVKPYEFPGFVVKYNRSSNFAKFKSFAEGVYSSTF